MCAPSESTIEVSIAGAARWLRSRKAPSPARSRSGNSTAPALAHAWQKAARTLLGPSARDVSANGLKARLWRRTEQLAQCLICQSAVQSCPTSALPPNRDAHCSALKSGDASRARWPNSPGLQAGAWAAQASAVRATNADPDGATPPLDLHTQERVRHPRQPRPTLSPNEFGTGGCVKNGPSARARDKHPRSDARHAQGRAGAKKQSWRCNDYKRLDWPPRWQKAMLKLVVKRA